MELIPFVPSLLMQRNGDEIAAAVFYYPRWKDQLYCDAFHQSVQATPA
jgi:hypothetical protein